MSIPIYSIPMNFHGFYFPLINEQYPSINGIRGSTNRWLPPGKVQVVPVGTQFNEYALWVFEPRGEPSGVLKPRHTMNHGEKQ